MGIPLVIDEKTRQRIQEVKAYAIAHRLDEGTIQKLIATQTAVGDNRHLQVRIPAGFLVIFSVEQQPPGWCYHLSVSLARQLGRYVRVEAHQEGA